MGETRSGEDELRANNSTWKRLDSFTVLALVTISCVALVFGIADGGLGMSEDSWSYLEATENMAAGEGYTVGGTDKRPLLRWPPGYSVALLPGVWWPFDVHAWGAYLNCALLGSLVLGVYTALRHAALDRVRCVLGTSLVVFGHTLLVQYGMLLSEALYLPLELLAVIALARARVSRGYGFLLLSAAACACATLTRFAGQSAILGGALFCLIPSSLDSQRNWYRTFAFLFVAQTPVILWLLRNWILTNSVSDLGTKPVEITAAPFLDVWRVMTTYWLPEGLERRIRHAGALLCLGAAMLALISGWKRSEREFRALFLSCMCIMGSYVLFVICAVHTARAEPHLDQRMFLPVMIPMAMCLTLASNAGGSGMRRALMFVLVVLVSIGLARTAIACSQMRTEGRYNAWLVHRY